jgi:phytoene dehydrogenase-like protein
LCTPQLKRISLHRPSDQLLQQLLDEANGWGFYGYDKGAYFEDLTDVAAVVPGVWLIGAATWPGPGVSGASGRAVARR